MNTFCVHFNQDHCRSCQLIPLDYQLQIEQKEKTLTQALQGLSLPPLLPTIHSREQNFRNKVKLTVTGSLENPIIGLQGEEDLDQGREILDCPIHVQEINETLPVIKAFIQEAKLAPYQISLRKGELKSLIFFYSRHSKEMYLRFVCRSKEPVTRIQKYLPQLLEKIPALKCVSVNIQPIPHAILEGEEEIILSEQKSINHGYPAFEMQLGPRAFVQTNQEVAEKLYQTAAQWIQESNTNDFLELFCGQGAFSFFAAPIIKRGLGIEINPDAIKVAQQTAEKFHYQHLSFKSADAAKVDEEIRNFKPDLLLVNPPRKGLGKAVDLLVSSLPSTIIYSSCSYETLAEDLKQLQAYYDISKIQIFDMFPHTTHFETLVLLHKR